MRTYVLTTVLLSGTVVRRVVTEPQLRERLDDALSDPCTVTFIVNKLGSDQVEVIDTTIPEVEG